MKTGVDNPRPLSRAFFRRPTLEVARDLIGAYLVDVRGPGPRVVRVVEVEAYIGEDDPACHAAPGLTARNRPMYGEPGRAYIYLIYGMYHCLNVVTEREGYPAAVLIRAAEPVAGELEVNPRNNLPYSTDGPGKLCRALNLSLRLNGLDLTQPPLYLAGHGAPPGSVATSARVGISSGLDKMWRFYDSTSPDVSQKRKQEPHPTESL
ncbi:MAG: DNA-3-methyladenine glycosylase [Candidatus Zixiibacteriota bacterium]